MKIKFEGEMKSGVSKKTGGPYTYIDLEFPSGYRKMVFLNGSLEGLSNYIISSIGKQKGRRSLTIVI